MFDPIKGPANHYQGPATGLGTEAGDTWHAAVSKVNAGFKNVGKAIEEAFTGEDAGARQGIAALEEAVAALQKRADEADAKLKALVTTAEAAAFAPAPTPPAPEEPKG